MPNAMQPNLSSHRRCSGVISTQMTTSSFSGSSSTSSFMRRSSTGASAAYMWLLLFVYGLWVRWVVDVMVWCGVVVCVMRVVWV